MSVNSHDSSETLPEIQQLSSLDDLIAFYEEIADLHMPIATPGPDEAMWISGIPAVLVLDPNASDWPSEFLNGLVSEQSHGVATYPVIVEQDDQYRHIYNADDELLVTMPHSNGFDRYAFLRHRYPHIFDARVQDEQDEGTDWLMGVYDAQRMIIQVTLMTPEGYAAWRTAVEKEAEADRLEAVETTTMLTDTFSFSINCWSLDGTNFIMGWNQETPGNYHVVERSLDLMSSLWTPVHWSQGVTNWIFSISTNDADYAFYRVAEFDPTYAQSDVTGSGLTALQAYLLGTDPTKRDTSGDGIPDGAVVLAGGNPLHNALHDIVLTLHYAYDEQNRLVTVYSASHTLSLTPDDADNISATSSQGVAQ